MRRKVLALGLGGVAGIGLLWAGASLLGLLAVASAEHRLWGLSVYLVMAVEDALAFLPLSVLTGSLLTMLHGPNSRLANATAVVAALAMLLSGVDWLSLSVPEAATTVGYFFLAPGAFMIVGVILGAVIAKRWSNGTARA